MTSSFILNAQSLNVSVGTFLLVDFNPVFLFFLWQHRYGWEPSERRTGGRHGPAACDPQPGRPAGRPAESGPGPSSQRAPGLLHADGGGGPSGRGPGQLGELEHTHMNFAVEWKHWLNVAEDTISFLCGSPCWVWGVSGAGKSRFKKICGSAFSQKFLFYPKESWNVDFLPLLLTVEHRNNCWLLDMKEKIAFMFFKYNGKKVC